MTSYFGSSRVLLVLLLTQAIAKCAQQKATLWVQLGHSDHVSSLTFSRTGKLLLSGSADKTARLWDVATGREVHRFEGQDYVQAVAFLPNENYLVTSTSNMVRV